jgi:hypothetical protein
MRHFQYPEESCNMLPWNGNNDLPNYKVSPPTSSQLLALELQILHHDSFRKKHKCFSPPFFTTTYTTNIISNVCTSTAAEQITGHTQHLFPSRNKDLTSHFVYLILCPPSKVHTVAICCMLCMYLCDRALALSCLQGPEMQNCSSSPPHALLPANKKTPYTWCSITFILWLKSLLTANQKFGNWQIFNTSLLRPRRCPKG